MPHNQDENDTDDENDILQDGQSVRVGMMFRDGLSPVQRAVADSTAHLCDAFGEPLEFPGCKPGYVFDSRSFNDEAASRHHARARDFEKASLSAAYKGGLADGDLVTIGDARLQVVGRNPGNGKLLLADASQVDARKTRKSVYEEYNHDVTHAWKRHNEKPAKEPDQDEFAMAGPLSDATEAVALRDAAYSEYKDELVNAWRRS